MICGIGTDILEIPRLQKALERNGKVFEEKYLTAEELAEADARGCSRLSYLAGRWCAKEAIAKMLGCGFGSDCAWLEICILDNDSGAPVATLSGTAEQRAKKLGITAIHLSISHEKTVCTATAIGESL